ncbi:MAG TPA: thioredoxin family protein [Vicinamibacterales bacterium]|nr:thioredoxin family protein [Vicinamibacterales bacterium]
MSLISASDQQRLRETFNDMQRPVRLLFFTQTLGCETCLQTRQILDELPQLSEKIAIEEVNFILDPDKARQYGVDRVPAVAIVGQDEKGEERDSNIRFLGAPAGYEFMSLIQAVLLVGGRPSALSEDSLKQIAAVSTPTTVHVFTTPTCPHCPRAVAVAHEMAFANPNITAYAVEATEFPDLARKYQVTGVPKTVVNDSVEILGALPPDAFVSQALAQPGS